VKTAPFVVGELLDRARIARLEAPTVATLHGAPVPRFGALKTFGDLCAWFLPEPDALRVFVRERAELPPAPQAIPAEGPFALPPPVPPYVTPERMYREEPSPRACPHCGKTATRFRDLGDRLVCPSCGASFAAS
jgi:rubredoxin